MKVSNRTASIAIMAILVMALGCSTPPVTTQYPVTIMLDPVTEETPNVITNR